MAEFSDWHSGPQGTLSTWRNKRKPAEISVQTDPVTYTESGSQVVNLASIETQTDASLGPSTNFEEMKPPYPPSLYAFFAKVTGPMCEALEENLNPLYNLSITMSMADRENMLTEDENKVALEKGMARKLYELRSPTTPVEGYRASCVAWSCNGSQVAVGYSAISHDRWCEHSAAVSVWSLGRLENQLCKPTKKSSVGMAPHKEIMLNSCISALEFHPSNSSVLIAGLYSGDIVMIDFYASAPSTSTTSIDQKNQIGHSISYLLGSGSGDAENGTINSDGIFHVSNSSLHASAVESVKWLTINSSTQLGQLICKNPSPSQHMVLSSAKDGLIGLWSINKTYNRLYLEKRFVILPRNLSDSIDHKTQISISMKEIGITALASCKLEPTTFLVGTFGCFVFQCDMTSSDEMDSAVEMDMLQSSKESSPLSNGQATFLRQMKSYVKAIDFSPFHQNLFLACTIHGHVEIQHTLKPGNPTLELFMTEDNGIDVKWSGRPMLFGVAWSKTLSLYDLTKSDVESSLRIEHKELLCSIAFNKSEIDLVATTDVKGYLHIWKLPASLKGTVESRQEEMDGLIKLGSIGNKHEPDVSEV